MPNFWKEKRNELKMEKKYHERRRKKRNQKRIIKISEKQCTNN